MHESDRVRLVALMYHGLHEDAADPGRFDPRYSVTPERFTQQMACIARRGGAWLPPIDGEFRLPASNTHAEVLITFDDGDVSNALQALPLLQRHGLKAVFFITSDFVGRGGMLTPAQLRALHEAGMRIGAHGRSHRFLSTLDHDELQRELHDSRNALADIIGAPVDLLALPGGRGGARELAAAEAAGYRAVFSSQPGDNQRWRRGDYVQRVAITREMPLPAFEQVLDWGGPAVARLRLRHGLLALPKRMLGDNRYDRLRQALVG